MLVTLDLSYDAIPASGQSAELIKNFVIHDQILWALFLLDTNAR